MEQTPAGSRWWHGAVLYQVYVRSWQDTNGDGFGDLRGIIGRLDHLSWLGVDGLWLSPTMPSPDEDWGYDVSDYVGVHPELGSLADMDELIDQACRRGMRVLLDLVPNHTSAAHPWFVDACTARDSAHRDYYVWADPASGGGPPSNWLDSVGESAWQWHQPTGQYYLHNYLPGQPDLNWWQPAVHEEFRQILRFWFDRGVAGFRIDVAHGLYKDKLLRDNPPASPDAKLDNRFGLRSVHNANQPQTHAVFRDWRRMAELSKPPRLLLGETWTGDLSRLAAYYGDNDELHLAFNFPFVFAEFAGRELPGIVEQTLRLLPAGACPVWTASNHDVGRFPTRWCGGDPRKIKLAMLILLTLPGTTVLYYGDEIGMPDTDVPPELRRDKMTMVSQGPPGSRDRGRTPMHWDGSASAGFTAAGVTPWLPVGDAAGCNVADQAGDRDSVLSLCRELIALRRTELGGRVASFAALPAQAGTWCYQSGTLTVTANLSDRPAPVPAGAGEPLLTSDGSEPADVLSPWQGVVARSGD